MISVRISFRLGSEISHGLLTLLASSSASSVLNKYMKHWEEDGEILESDDGVSSDVSTELDGISESDEDDLENH